MTDKSLVKNAADEEQVAKAKLTEKDRAERVLNDLRWLMNDEKGRRLMWGLLTTTKVFTANYPDSGNPAAQQFEAGMKAVGIAYLTALNEASPDGYAKMVKEAKDGE